MRLIDADLLIESLGFYNPPQEREENAGQIITLEDFDKMPTAYDVDAVVKKLKRRSKEYNSGVRLHGKPEEMITNEAIEIVKGGGVE